MWIKKNKYWISSLLIAMYAYGVQAQHLSLDELHWKSGVLGYNPLNTDGVLQEELFNVYFYETEPFTYFITVSEGGEEDDTRTEVLSGREFNPDDTINKDIFLKRKARFKQHVLFYQLYRDRETLVPLYDESVHTDIVGGLIQKSLSRNHPSPQQEKLYMAIFPNQWVPAGRYKDSLKVKMYQGRNDRFEEASLVRIQYVTVMITVPSVTMAKFLGTINKVYYTRADISVSEALTIKYQMASNEPYRIIVSWDNGYLKGYKKEKLQYDLKIDGETIQTMTGLNKIIGTYKTGKSHGIISFKPVIPQEGFPEKKYRAELEEVIYICIDIQG